MLWYSLEMGPSCVGDGQTTCPRNSGWLYSGSSEASRKTVTQSALTWNATPWRVLGRPDAGQQVGIDRDSGRSGRNRHEEQKEEADDPSHLFSDWANDIETSGPVVGLFSLVTSVDVAMHPGYPATTRA